jgi:DNA-binding MarR family transcriptional regulator
VISAAQDELEIELELARVASFRSELRRFLRRTETVTAAVGLTPQRYDLLLMIRVADAAGEGVRLTDLCELLHLQQTAVTELVKRSEQAGLIDRRAAADDGRVSLLKLTAEGERRLLGVVDALRDDRRSLAAELQEIDDLLRAAAA